MSGVESGNWLLPLLCEVEERAGERRRRFLRPLFESPLIRVSRGEKGRSLRRRLRHQHQRPWRKILPGVRARFHLPVTGEIRRCRRAGRTRFTGSMTTRGMTSNSSVVHVLTRMMAGSVFPFMQTQVKPTIRPKRLLSGIHPIYGTDRPSPCSRNLGSYFRPWRGNLTEMLDNFDIGGNNPGAGGSNPR